MAITIYFLKLDNYRGTCAYILDLTFMIDFFYSHHLFQVDIVLTCKWDWKYYIKKYRTIIDFHFIYYLDSQTIFRCNFLRIEGSHAFFVDLVSVAPWPQFSIVKIFFILLFLWATTSLFEREFPFFSLKIDISAANETKKCSILFGYPIGLTNIQFLLSLKIKNQVQKHNTDCNCDFPFASLVHFA